MRVSRYHEFVAIYRTRLGIAAAVCALVAVLLLWGVLRIGIGNAERVFREESELIYAQLQHRLNSTNSVLSALAGWHHSQMEIAPGELAVFAGETLANHPHIGAVFFMQRLDREGRQSFEKSKQEEGYVSFNVWEKNAADEVSASLRKSLYFPVTFVEPLTPASARMIGYDMAADKVLSEALYRALQTGDNVVSRPLADAQGNKQFYVFKAVYKGKLVPVDIKSRLEQIDGVFAAQVTGAGLAALVLKKPVFGNGAVLMHHNAFSATDPAGHIFGQTNPRQSRFTPYFSYSVDMAEVNQPCVISFSRSMALGWRVLLPPVLVMLACLTLILVIRHFLRADLQHNLDNDMAQDALFREKEKAEVTLHSIADGVIRTDSENRVEYLNEVAESLTGWRKKAAVDKPLGEVFVALDPDKGTLLSDRFTHENIDNGNMGNHAGLLLKSRDGLSYFIKCSAAKIRDRSGDVIGMVIVFRDVTLEQALAKEMAHQARHDELTGLYNRREFEQQLQRSLEVTPRPAREDVLCFIDLDQFKVVNDTCGHAAGDELLKQLTHVLRMNIRDSDILARLGGDEFGLILKGCGLVTAKEIATLMLNAIRDCRFNWEGKRFDIGASMGLVAIDQEFATIHEVMSAADSACYLAKDKGRNRIFSHSPDDHELLTRQGEMQWVHKIHDAFEQKRFRLFRQKVEPLNDGALPLHYEVLLRMRDDTGEYVLPMAFIPAAERYNIMSDVDRWVVRESLAHIGLDADDNSIYNLNLSGRSVGDEGFFDFVVEQIRVSGVAPARICFEITETAAISNLSAASEFIRAMQKKGCSFALDDFGSGLSSFGYLKTLPVNYLKIDGSFVVDMVNDPVDKAMVACIAEVGRVMGIKTIAEYVENEATKEQLKMIGVDYAQGYVVSPPEEWVVKPVSDAGASSIARWGSRSH